MRLVQTGWAFASMRHSRHCTSPALNDLKTSYYASLAFLLTTRESLWYYYSKHTRTNYWLLKVRHLQKKLVKSKSYFFKVFFDKEVFFKFWLGGTSDCFNQLNQKQFVKNWQKNMMIWRVFWKVPHLLKYRLYSTHTMYSTFKNNNQFS